MYVCERQEVDQRQTEQESERQEVDHRQTEQESERQEVDHRQTEQESERQEVDQRQTEQDPYICCLQETHFRPRDTYRLKVRGWKRYSMQMEIKRKLE